MASQSYKTVTLQLNSAVDHPVKKVFSLAVSLFLVTLFMTCKETSTEFSPGAGDTRITGTWQLVERKFPVNVDSMLIDSFLVKAHYEIDSVTKDSVYRQDYYKKSVVKLTRSVDSTVHYPGAPPQTLTFGTDGKLSANGSDMSYYYPIHYFRVDSTIQDGLGVNLYINTNRATVPFRISLRFQGDNLFLQPRCERSCYSKFVRAK